MSNDTIVEKLAKLNLEPPNLHLPTIVPLRNIDQEHSLNARSMPNSPTQAAFPKNVRTASSTLIGTDASSDLPAPLEAPSGLKPYLQMISTRIEKDSYIQEIRELSQVPVLIRAEIGMALPCLTVRVLNPFSEQ